MKIITSIMCSDKDQDIKNQLDAVHTWKKSGFDVISCNIQTEIDLLKKIFIEIEFVEIQRTGKEKYGKTFPYISDMLQILKKRSIAPFETVGIINSDIYLRNITSKAVEKLFLENDKKLICLHRYDIDDVGMITGDYYFSGIDVFFLSEKYLNRFLDEGFLMGRPEWDHWMVYTAINAGLEILEIKNPVAFHVRHQQRWTAKESSSMVEAKAGKKENQTKLFEEYYRKTNEALADVTNRIYIDRGFNKNGILMTGNSKLLYFEKDIEHVIEDQMIQYSISRAELPVGLGYRKAGKFYRICALHGELKRRYQVQFVLEKGTDREIKADFGDLGIYMDFKDSGVSERLGRFYIYPAGRAARLMADCLNEYKEENWELLGLVDQDKNLQVQFCMGKRIYDPKVLLDAGSYDSVLIVSNLYVDEIYEELSRIVDKNKLIVI